MIENYCDPLLSRFLRENGFRFGGIAENKIYLHSGKVGNIEEIFSIPLDVVKDINDKNKKLFATYLKNEELYIKWKETKISNGT